MKKCRCNTCRRRLCEHTCDKCAWEGAHSRMDDCGAWLLSSWHYCVKGEIRNLLGDLRKKNPR